MRHLFLFSLFTSPFKFKPSSSPFLSSPFSLLCPKLFSPMAAPPTPRSTTPPIEAAVTATEVAFSRRLWTKFRKDSAFSLFSPFVISLASGHLRLDTFRHCLSQELHFLKAFAQAYELTEDCADDDEGKISISELRKSVLEHLKLRDSYVEEWGSESDLGKETSPSSATVKYTNFLLATASGKVEGLKGLCKLTTPFERTKIAAYTLGVIAPCMRLYAILGKELQALLVPEDYSHPYQRWIGNYSCECFQGSAQQIEELLDRFSVSLTGEELDIIENLYRHTVKLDIEFFSTHPPVQRTVTPLFKELSPAEWQLVLFSDFDLTCTVLDSSAILAEVAIITAPKCDQNSSKSQIARMSSADLRNTWAALSRQYTTDYKECIENVLAAKNGEGEFCYETLHKSLELLSDFEKKANAKVIESGVLKGVSLEGIKKAGESIIFQEGCSSFFQRVVQTEDLDVNAHVLSYCWCGDLIRSAFSSVGLQALNVHANEFKYEGSISTGDIDKKIESPIDKVQAFSEILTNSSSEKKNLSVYIGDSVGDLLCLLKADIGIVVGSNSSLRRVGSHFGVSFVPLFRGSVKKQKELAIGNSFNWTTQPGVLYTASSWAEIHAFILGK